MVLGFPGAGRGIDGGNQPIPFQLFLRGFHEETASLPFADHPVDPKKQILWKYDVRTGRHPSS
jgi:hypothetical protein